MKIRTAFQTTIQTSLAFVLMFVASSFLKAENLSSTEKSIVSNIDQQLPSALLLLEKAVNINSGSMNFDGVRKVGELFKQELQTLGFEVRWIDGSAFGRAGHLYAEFGSEESTAKKILLIGHLDTVFAKDGKFQAFKVIDQSHIAGPGITDMKGGDVVMLSALKGLKASGALQRMQIRVLMMGDEEKRGSPYSVATNELIAAGIWADVALGFEDGDGNPKTAVVSRRGSTGWRLKVEGRAAHSSQIFREKYGYGAIFEAARILNQFRTELSQQPNLTFNPGVIVGGTNIDYDAALARGKSFGKNNVIAQSTIVSGDIRALSPQQLKDAQQTMQSIVAKNLAETSARLDFFDGYPPMAPNKGNHTLLSLYSQASQDLGFGRVKAVDPRKAGAADISFVANHVDMALDGLGLMGTGGHTIKEVADISTLSTQSKRAAIVIYRLSKP